MVSNVTNAESVVVDVFVIHISVFYAFDILNDAESEWKRKDFVGCFCDDLCDHQPQHDVEGQDGTSLENEWEKIESQRKEDEAVHAFACQGGEDGAHGEMVGEVSLASVAHFHLAHDHRVENRTGDEGNKAGCYDLGCEGEHLFEAFICSGLDGRECTRYASQCYDEKVHGKANPDDESGFAIAPHFGYDVVENV